MYASARAFFRARPDSEHEVAFNRIAIIAVVFCYWLAAGLLGYRNAADSMVRVAPAMFFYALAGFSLLAHMAWRPGVSHARRALAIPLDLVLLSWGVHLGDDVTALLYPIYLWVILGNGFRYGVSWLLATTFLAVLCFGVVVFATPFWREHLAMSAGLALGLVAIPAYAATLIRKLNAARKAAEEAVKAKSMFLASVSHELRTPLNAIVGFSDVLCDTPLNAEQKDMVRTIGRSGRSLASLINSILDVSRMEIGKLPTKMEEVDLPVVLRDIREMLAVQAQEKCLRVSVHVDARVPRRVVVNLAHLEEILVNLGGNAVKFTKAGHVLIHVAPLSLGDGKARLRFEVRDTGIGIDKKAQELIFESFAQADETIIDRFGGTGLGLAIVKQLVEGGGGRIGVDSEPGEGSTFWFEMEVGAVESDQERAFTRKVTLISADTRLRARFEAVCADVTCHDVFPANPAAVSFDGPANERPILVLDEHTLGHDFARISAACAGEASDRPWPVLWLREAAREVDVAFLSRFSASIDRTATQSEILAALGVAAAACDGETQSAPEAVEVQGDLDILVAEDNKTNQMVIKRILESAGHRVTIAENGEQAIEALGARGFDIVFMDVNMPVLNGIEATKLARFIDLEVEPTPIYGLTADATAETRAKCLDAGMTDCLTKPIDRPKLLACLAAFQRSRKPDARPSAPSAIESEAQSIQAGKVAVDPRALGDLEALGGKDFVNQIVDQFVSDAANVLKDISQAVARSDALAFREQAHALRSCAANVGARGVYNLCLEWRAIDTTEVAKSGEAHVRRLEQEFALARAALGR